MFQKGKPYKNSIMKKFIKSDLFTMIVFAIAMFLAFIGNILIH